MKSDRGLAMATLITDPHLEESLKAQRHAWGADRFDEVWEEVYIMSPQPNIEHQELVSDLVGVMRDVVRPPQGGKVFPGINLSDRAEDWEHNYRCPDVAVFLRGNLAEKFKAHYRGPADFLAEIVSANDDTREKIPFYSGLGVRELLIVDRYPWSLELYRHDGKELVLVGQSSVEEGQIITSAVITSAVVPLSFQLLAAEPRPQIHIVEIGGERDWYV
jgi:Uma2 family endonuclease